MVGSGEDEGASAGLRGYRSKADLVTEYLRGELQAGRPGPGERLVLARVAAQLGVSKIPVREAVTRLVGEGLLETRTNVGPVVPRFTAHEVLETALMRVAVEGAAIDSALPRHDDQTTERLRDVLGQMATATDDFPRLNVEFHLAVIAPSPYQEMYRTAQSLLERAQRFAVVQLVPGYRDEAHHEHEQMLELVLARDLQALQQLHRDHVLAAARRLTETMD